jgi:uncharacterized RDD family membrane protein YckC
MSANEPTAGLPSPPSAPVGGVPIAARWRRAVAVLVDVALAAAMLFGCLLTVAFFAYDPDADEETLGAVVGIVGFVLWFGLLVLYYGALLSRSGPENGQTLGKQAMKVRVVTASGRPVGFGRAVVRDVLATYVPFAVTVGLYTLLDCAFGLFDGRRQALHDKLCKTYVVPADVPFGTGRPLFGVAYAVPVAPRVYGPYPSASAPVPPPAASAASFDAAPELPAERPAAPTTT